VSTDAFCRRYFDETRVDPLILPLFLLFVSPPDWPSRTRRIPPDPVPELRKPGSYLIVWTATQAAPEPAPQPSGRQTPSPDPKPETQTPAHRSRGIRKLKLPPKPNLRRKALPARISKEGDTYVLKVSDTSLTKLDDQDKAKNMKAKGSQSPCSGSKQQRDRVQKIEPVSEKHSAVSSQHSARPQSFALTELNPHCPVI